jgi:hypothetical protein
LKNRLFLNKWKKLFFSFNHITFLGARLITSAADLITTATSLISSAASLITSTASLIGSAALIIITEPVIIITRDVKLKKTNALVKEIYQHFRFYQENT